MTKEEYADYLATPWWRGLARIVKELADNHCAVCGATGMDVGNPLNVHHNTYARVPFRERLSDLVCLCRSCHSLFSKRKEPR